jgi:hypothetical protein
MAIPLTIPFSRSIPEARAPRPGPVPDLEARTKALGGQQLGRSIAGIGDLVQEWQRRRDETALANAKADAAVWSNDLIGAIQNKSDDELSAVDPETGKSGFAAVGDGFNEAFTGKMTELGSRLSRRTQSEFGRWARVEQAQWGGQLTNGLLRRERGVRRAEVLTHIDSLAKSNPEKLLGYIGTTGRLWYNEPEMPELLERAHTAVASHLVEVGKPEAAEPYLESKEPDFITPGRYTEVMSRVRLATQRKRNEQKDLALEEVRAIAVGEPERGLAGRPETALNALTATADRLPENAGRSDFVRAGMNIITEAQLNDDAEVAKGFMQRHQSLYDASDYATLMGRAQHAIDYEGGSTDTRRRQLLTELYSAMPDQDLFAKRYAQIAPQLTGQSRTELMRAFGRRDVTPEKLDYGTVAGLLQQMGDAWATGDHFEVQRALTEARVGDLRRGEMSELDQVVAAATPEMSARAVPVLDKKTYLRLQKIVSTKIPTERALAVREGLAGIQRALGPGLEWDEATGEAMLTASEQFVTAVSNSAQPNLRPEDIYGMAIDQADAARPKPAPAEPQEPAKPKESALKQISRGLSAGLAAPSIRRSNTRIVPKEETLEALMRTDEERAEVKALRQQGLTDDQVVEKIAPSRFPAWYWQEIQKSPEAVGDVHRLLLRRKTPAEIMLRSRGGE